jgi:hypothetical protein
MARKARTAIEISYKWNDKDEPERLNRAYDMIFDKIIKKINENGKKSVSSKT